MRACILQSRLGRPSPLGKQGLGNPFQGKPADSVDVLARGVSAAGQYQGVMMQVGEWGQFVGESRFLCKRNCCRWPRNKSGYFEFLIPQIGPSAS